jgi:hypothetical protein
LGQPVLDKLDLVYLRGKFHVYEPAEESDGLLRLIPPDMFGPPEKCYYRKVSDHPALLKRSFGKGSVACFPFGIGQHYHAQAHAGHAALLIGAMDQVLELPRRLRVETSPLVEINHREDARGQFEWVSLYNHSGHRGQALHPPIPIRSVGISLLPKKSVRRVRSLAGGQDLDVKSGEDGRILVTLPELALYDVVVVEY